MREIGFYRDSVSGCYYLAIWFVDGVMLAREFVLLGGTDSQGETLLLQGLTGEGFENYHQNKQIHVYDPQSNMPPTSWELLAPF